MRLKALSYNVHKLLTPTRTRYFLPELKQIFKEMDLDFVFLQEIRGLHPKKHQEHYDNNPLEHLADEIWPYFVYGKNAISTFGNHGNAILSKYPFERWYNHDISNHIFEKRSLLLGQIRVNEKPIQLACTHLDLTEFGRNRQFEQIVRLFKKEVQSHLPLIFCGDFNDWNGKLSQKFRKEKFQTAEDLKPLLTFPARFPLLPLDRIFYKNIQCIESQTLKDSQWKKMSDHLPIYSEWILQ